MQYTLSFRRLRPLAFGLIVFALLLLLLQHWGMMLSNSDDPWITRATMTEIHAAASSQGRFWLIPIKLMAQIPYQLGSWEAANIIKIMTNGLVFIAFVCFCCRLTNVLVGLLSGAVWLALIDLSPGEYSPFHGFLMMFNIQFAALFLSFTLYLRHLDNTENQKVIVFPFLLYAFAMLAYEPMLFYAAAYPAMYLYRLSQRQLLVITTAKQLISFVKLFAYRHFPLALAIALYLLLFIAYRAAQPHTVRSIEISGSLWAIAKTTYLFSIYGLHIEMSPFTNYSSSTLGSIHVILGCLFGAAICCVVFLLTPKIRYQLHPQYLYSVMGITSLLFFVFSPNILLSLSDGYQKWAEFDPHYVGSYFSSFPLAILVSILLLYLIGGEKSRHEKILFIGVLYVLFSSSVDNYIRWAQLASDNRAGSLLWSKAVSQLLEKGVSQHTPTVVCALRGSPRNVKGDDVYWGRYLSEVLSAQITYVAKPLPSRACTYTIDFDTLKHTSNQFK
jgi:hypothetical protein